MEAARNAWQNITPQTHGIRDDTRSREASCRHALESRDKDLLTVQYLENKLDVIERWTPAHPKWEAAAEMVAKRRYQRCLDTLEALVVSRMFELTKMNMSKTGKYIVYWDSYSP